MVNKNPFDWVDVIVYAVAVGGIASLVGIGTQTFYGHAFSDPAIASGGTVFTFGAAGAILAGLLAYWSNDGFSLSTLFDRPRWEQGTVITYVGGILLLELVPGFKDFTTGSDIWGTFFGLLMVSGFLIIAYRTEGDKKLKITEAIADGLRRGGS